MQTLRILHAEDDLGVLETVSTLLKRHGPQPCEIDVEIEQARRFLEFVRRAFEPWDAILLDLTFPDSSAENTLHWLSQNFTKCAAVIVVTGSDRDRHLEESFEAGALRFILKTDMQRKPKHLLLEIYECYLIKQAILKSYVPKA